MTGRRAYRGQRIVVTFDSRRCIHAAECLRGLPEVFDNSARPWVRPDDAPPDQIAEVVSRCPSGALLYERLDGGPQEQPAAGVTITATRNGPLLVRGDIELADSAGQSLGPRPARGPLPLRRLGEQALLR